MGLGGLFVNPDISPWVETALVIAQRNPAATTVAMAAMALTFGGDVSMSRTVANRLDFATGDSLMLTDTGQFQLGTAGAADVTMSRPFASSMLWASTPATAVTVTGFSIVPGAHLNLPASIEVTDFHADLNRTVQWATGALTQQRSFQISAPTLAFVAASVVSDAATLFVSNAPLAGAFATLTRSYTAWLSREDGTNSTALEVLRLQRTTSNGAFGATGIGARVDFWSEDNAGTVVQAATVDGFLPTVAAATREGGVAISAPRSTDQALTTICHLRGGDVNGPYALFGATGTVSAARYRFASGRLAIDYTSTIAVAIGPSGLATTTCVFDTTNHQLLANSTNSAVVPRYSKDGDTNTGLGFSAADTLVLITNAISRIDVTNAYTLITNLFAGSVTTEAQLIANVDNWAIGATIVHRIDSDAARTVTGLTTGTTLGGQVLIFINFGAFAITFNHQDGASGASNRMILAGGLNQALAADQVILFVYDGTTSRWRQMTARL